MEEEEKQPLLTKTKNFQSLKSPHLHTPSRTAYYSLFTLTYINILNYLERYVLAGMKDLVKTEFVLSDAETGYVMTAFIGVYMIASPVFAWLADTGKLEKKTIIYYAITFWCLCSLCTSFAPNFTVFLIIRGLVGIGEAGYSTISVVMLAEYFGDEKRNIAIGIYQLAIPVGAGLGFFFGAFFSSLLGWRYTYVASAALASTSLIFLLFLPTPPENYNAIKDDNKELEEIEEKEEKVEKEEIAEKEEKVEKESNWEATKKIIGNGEWMMAALGVTAVSFVAGALADWFPTYLVRVKEFSVQEAGLVSSGSVIIGGIFGTILGAFSVELFSRYSSSHSNFPHSPNLLLTEEGMNKARKSFIISSISLIPPVFGLAVLLIYIDIHRIEVIAAMIIIFQIFMWCYSGPVTTLLVELVPLTVRSRAMSISIILFHVLGDAISPPIVGFISDQTGSLNTACYILPPIILLASVLWFLGYLKLKFSPHYYY